MDRVVRSGQASRPHPAAAWVRSNEMNPSFSIITVTLNPGSLLECTLRSVREQTYKEYEHIIKDGGSTHLPTEEYGTENLRVIVSKDSGIYNAMNQGLEACKNEYVLFLNAGDTFYAKDSLCKIAEFCKKNNHPDFVYGNCFHVARNAEIAYQPRLSKYFFYQSTICHQACILKRKAFETTHFFDESFRICADALLISSCVLVHRVAYAHINEPIVNYCGGGFSESPSNRKIYREERRRLVRKLFPLPSRCVYFFRSCLDRLVRKIGAVTQRVVRNALWCEKN